MGADFGVRDSIEELLELVGEAIEMGAPRIKLKCAKGWVRAVVHESQANQSNKTETVLRAIRT